MSESVKQILAKPIQLSGVVAKSAGEAQLFRQECFDLKSRAERLVDLLRQAARAGADLYERPARRIVADTEQALDKALALTSRCRANGLVSRVFTILPAAAFKKAASHLDNSIADVSWLLRVSSSSDDDINNDGGLLLGLPPIAQNEPILFLIWAQIAMLQTGSIDARAEAAASLASLARDSERNGKLIIEEDGVAPLLRLLKEGKPEGQENAARAIGLLGQDAESVEKMVLGGVCSGFSKALKDAPMRVQAVVAWAVAELASAYPKCQDLFAQNNVVRLLVGHLAFETIQEHSKYTITTKPTSIHSVVMANTNHPQNNHHNHSASMADEEGFVAYPLGNKPRQGRNEMHAVIQSTMANQNRSTINRTTASPSPSTSSAKERELQDPKTKAHMKAMAARALWKLAKGNATICKSITESRALLCFATLLEKGSEEVRHNSALALMEIAKAAESDTELRRSAFKPNSPAAKAVVEQLLRVVEKAEYDELLIPAVVSLGCLARTFRATETRIIGPLVQLLDGKEMPVSDAAAAALTKFACTENYLHVDHCKAIIAAGAARHLIQLVYFGEQAQLSAAVLLSYVALQVPDSEELAEAQVLTVLEWASKQATLVQDPALDPLVYEAKSKLELYQSRAPRGFR